MSWPVLPVVFEAESFSEAKQKKNTGWMRFCFPCWTADEKVPAVNRKCCGQIWTKPRIPPSPRTKLLKGCCSFTPGMDSTFQAALLHGIAWNIILHHPDDILKVYDCRPLDGEWMNFWSSGPDYLEPLRGWARKRERMLGTCTTSRGRRSSFYVFHSPGGVSTDVVHGVRGVRILWRWITGNHWWLMIDDDDDDDEDRIWVLPNVWLVRFKFFKYIITWSWHCVAVLFDRTFLQASGRIFS